MLVAVAIVLVIVLAAPQAAAQPRDVCIEAHETGQRLRNDGKLREAGAKLEACTNPSCPTPVQEDCARWREEIDAAQPTVVPVMRRGNDVLREASLTVDGERVQAMLDGRAVAVDPGERSFRFETADGRVVERRVVIVEGEKNRVIEARLPAPPKPPPRPTIPREEPGVPAAFWVAGSIGVAGVAAFAILGGIGLDRETTLRDECAGACAQGDVDAVRDLYLAADIAGAAGIVALITATVIGIADIVADEEVALEPFSVRF